MVTMTLAIEYHGIMLVVLKKQKQKSCDLLFCLHYICMLLTCLEIPVNVDKSGMGRRLGK